MGADTPPPICQGQGGRASHLREFGNLLDQAESKLNTCISEKQPLLSTDLEELRGAVGRLRACDSCDGCARDRHDLQEALDAAWRALQSPAAIEVDKLRDLSRAIAGFREVKREIVTVRADGDSDLWFTHDSVRPRFSHGKHKDSLVSDLARELVEADTDSVTGFALHAVLHHGRRKCFGNRRLWAIWEASRQLGRGLRVEVVVHPLLPGLKFNDGEGAVNASVLRKFEIAHSSKSNGDQPPMRQDKVPESSGAEPHWLQKYKDAVGPDGAPLRTSVLPLLNSLAPVAQHIVEGPHKVILMSGSTGCGKSTQVTQAVYDFVRARDGDGRGPSIVCTQPRRVAACSLDDQVNTDRFFREVWPEELKQRITAHQIQGQTNKNSNTKLLFCTAGVLLQMVRRDGRQGIREFHYIFLDEVHERTIEDDLLMNFLCSPKFMGSSNAKVVVMSATLSIAALLAYLRRRFGSRSEDLVGCLSVDSVKQLDQLAACHLHLLAQFSGLDLSDHMEEDREELVQRMTAAQVVRPHPMRLAFLDDLLYHIVCREEFSQPLLAAGVTLKPVGCLDPLVLMVVDSAWQKTLADFSRTEPFKVMLRLVGPTDSVISKERECFSKHFCCEMMHRRPRHRSVLIVSSDELQRVKDALPPSGPATLLSEVALASGMLPVGALLQHLSYGEGSGRDRASTVTSVSSLPNEYTRHFTLTYACKGNPSADCSASAGTPFFDTSPFVALVFLPGLSMVTDFQYALQSWAGLHPSEVFPLHGKVRQEEQTAAVQVIHAGRRAILATNIAESSITVPNADVVVDLCLSRTMRWNEDRLGQLLDLDLATKDSMNQRAGRVARTKAGFVVRMLTREEFEEQPDGRLPEMLRRPVDKVMLKIINMAPVGHASGVDADAEIRACLSPPKDDKIREALKELQEVNAVQALGRGGRNFRALRLGTLLEDLPMDIRLGLLVAWGAQLGMVYATVDAAVMLQAHNVVGEPRATLQDGGKAFIQHCAKLREFANGFPSDIVMLVNVLRSFRTEAKRVGWVDGTEDVTALEHMQRWCVANGANFVALRSIDSTVVMIHERVRAVVPSSASAQGDEIAALLPDQLLAYEESACLMVLFCGAFYRFVQQYRKASKDSLLSGEYNQDKWADNDIVVSWDDGKSQKYIRDRIQEFFTQGRCGVFGSSVDHGVLGTTGGWIRIRLRAQDNDQRVFGYPREVVDVLNLRRDFGKLCDLDETSIELEHKTLKQAVPVFWRWEELTEKRQAIVLPASSIATPYLEAQAMAKQELNAAVFGCKFESFHTKTQKRWQKAETLTLLPILHGQTSEQEFLPEVVLKIFGATDLAGQASRLMMLGVPGLHHRLSPQTCSLAEAIRKQLCSHECLLQEFGEATYPEWVQQTTTLCSKLRSLLDIFGGPLEMRALSRLRPLEPSASMASASEIDSDASDSELAESESDLRCCVEEATLRPVAAPGGPVPSPANSTVCLLMDVDYWWHASGCSQQAETATHIELFKSSLSEIERAVGPVLHITARGTSPAPTWQHIFGRSQRASVDFGHAPSPTALGIALAVRAMEYADGRCSAAWYPPRQLQHLVLLAADPGLMPLLEHLKRQQCMSVWIAAFACSERVLRELGSNLSGSVVRLSNPAAAGLQSAAPARGSATALAPTQDEPSPEPSPPLAAVPKGKKLGKVKSYNAQSGYGFIFGGQRSGGNDVYLPSKNCKEGYMPSVGDCVYYELGRQKNGKLIANNVEKAE